MRTASLSSVLSVVRSSLFRAHDDAAGCTHTNDIPRAAASCASTIHRCPVGSHATVTPANPFPRARSAAQSSAAPRSHALHRNVRRARTFESWSVTTSICLRSARSIPTIAFVIGTAARSRESRAIRFRSPRETPLPLFMNVLLLACGTPSPTSASGGRSPRQTRPRRTPFYAALTRTAVPCRLAWIRRARGGPTRADQARVSGCPSGGQPDPQKCGRGEQPATQEAQLEGGPTRGVLLGADEPRDVRRRELGVAAVGGTALVAPRRVDALRDVTGEVPQAKGRAGVQTQLLAAQPGSDGPHVHDLRLGVVLVADA